MKKKHLVYATAAVLLIGGGTLSVAALTADDKKHHTIAVEVTTEATTESNDISTESAAEATTESNVADKKDDNQLAAASTAEISSNLSTDNNDNQTVSAANSGTTVPSDNGSSSGNGGSSGGNGSSDNGNSSGNGGSTGNGGSGGGNSGNGNGSSGGSTPVAHTHNWQPVYKTIHHDEVSHTEKVLVKDAWDEPVYASGTRCGKCRYEWVGGAAVCQMDENGGHYCPSCGTILEYTGFSSGTIQTGTIHHEAQYEDKKIIDKAAYDEQVIDYYKCSCGETKK